MHLNTPGCGLWVRQRSVDDPPQPNFLSRLMEQEGIYYFFEGVAGKHTLVLADAISASEACPPGFDTKRPFSARPHADFNGINSLAAHERKLGSGKLGYLGCWQCMILFGTPVHVPQAHSCRWPQLHATRRVVPATRPASPANVLSPRWVASMRLAGA